jgi:Na+/H+-dicarboxylate symporter
MRILVSWILRLTPVAVFVLGLSLSSRLGSEVIRVLASFVVVLCGMLVGFTLLLYPFVALLGRVSPRRFARAVGPAQIVAFGSRSSLASLPAMMDGARALRLPPETAAFVLPLSVAALKIHRPISSLVNLFFLAHLFGIELNGAMVVTFLLTVVVLRFTSAGLPGEASPLTTLPAYVAVGIPIQGVVLVETVDTVPDMFKTLVNVTGGVALAAVVSRWAPSPLTERDAVGTAEVEPHVVT